MATKATESEQTLTLFLLHFFGVLSLDNLPQKADNTLARLAGEFGTRKEQFVAHGTVCVYCDDSPLLGVKRKREQSGRQCFFVGSRIELNGTIACYRTSHSSTQRTQRYTGIEQSQRSSVASGRQ